MNGMDGNAKFCGSRREFVKGVAAMVAIARWRAWAAEAGVPEYYTEHLAKVAARIKILSEKCDDRFFFITDLHIPSNRCVSGRILARLIAETDVRKVVCGGDMPEAFGDKESLDRTIATYHEQWVSAVELAGGEFYPAKGNHDFTIKDNPTVASGFTYSGKYAHDVLMGTAAVKANAVTNPDDPEACYYYVDFKKSRTRYIVADTTDSICADRSYWAVQSGMGGKQLDWLAENALLTIPRGWSALVVQHIPMAGIVSGGDTTLFAPWRNLLEAYQNRGKTVVCGKEYDFSNVGGVLLCNLTGHEHSERQTFQRGIWHITQPCDTAYGDYIDGSKPWCKDLPEKKKGTVYEQTFDAVHIDRRNNALHFTRIGGGGNRTFHLNALHVKVGKSLQIKVARWMGDVTWGCYDANKTAKRRNPENKYQLLHEYFNEVAEISPDGVLYAKKRGEAIVLAIAADGSKEIFPVCVA